MHGGVDAARVGVLTGKAEVVEIALAGPVARRVERLDLDAGSVADGLFAGHLALVVGTPLTQGLFEPREWKLHRRLAHGFASE